ncbi:hypothetical protein THAOC_13165, partial [Thalassiosira oceanica]
MPSTTGGRADAEDDSSSASEKRGQRRGFSRRDSLPSATKFSKAVRRHSLLLSSINRGSFTSRRTLPEEGVDLHSFFRSATSLTRMREELKSAQDGDAENNSSTGVCARTEKSGGGRLLLHCIGLNSELISSGKSSAATLSRVNEFVMSELLPAHQSAIIHEDDEGRIPFTEAISSWISSRRAIRKWKLETDKTKQRVSVLAAKLKRRMAVAAMKRKQNLEEGDDSDSESLSAESASVTSSVNSDNVYSFRREQTFTSFLFGNNDEREARRELKMIVESADDAVFCIDEKGLILMTNKAATKQFGWDKNALIGSNIARICNRNDAPNHTMYLERYLRTGVKRVMGNKRELLARRKDGSVFWIELGLTEVSIGLGKFLFIGVVKDLTELKKHRRSLDYSKSSDLLDNAADEAHRMNQKTRGIPLLVEWCLSTLSDFVDHNGFNKNTEGDLDDEDDESVDLMSSVANLKYSFTSFTDNKETQMNPTLLHELVVEKVAAIPHLLEELLLIEDPEARRRVFDMSIVHKVLFSRESLGDGAWLMQMLDKSIRVQKSTIKETDLSGDLDTDEGRAYQLQMKIAADECRALAEAVVFYLEQVSSLSVQDDLHVFNNLQLYETISKSRRNLGRHVSGADFLSTGDVSHFQEHRDKLFNTVGSLNGLVRRLGVLDDDLGRCGMADFHHPAQDSNAHIFIKVKRAAATLVIRKLLDRVMFSPYACISALFDGINHLLLLVAFRLGPAPAMFHLANNDKMFNHQHYLLANIVLMTCVVFFGTKAIHAGLAKWAISTNLFWQDAFSFWSMLETVPLVAVVISSLSVDMVLHHRAARTDNDADVPFALRTLVAGTTPFLWLRILAYIKIRNKQLATFILCSVEIMKVGELTLSSYEFCGLNKVQSCRTSSGFCLCSFAQMWLTLTMDTSQANTGGYYLNGYLKAYTMMLGDLEIDSLKTHPLIAILFVVYTFGVTIVLLNILIAIVSDSYANSFVSSKMMLGKARVMFVSELLSIKTFHQMWMEGKTGNTRRNINYFFFGIAAFHCFIVTGTVVQKIEYGTYCETMASPRSIKLEATFTFTFMLFFLFAMKSTVAYVLNTFNDKGGLINPTDSDDTAWFKSTMNWFVKRTFSSFSASFDSLFDRDDKILLEGYGDEFGDSQEHRAEEKLQRSLEKTKKQLKNELKSLSSALNQGLIDMESQNRNELLK